MRNSYVGGLRSALFIAAITLLLGGVCWRLTAAQSPVDVGAAAAAVGEQGGEASFAAAASWPNPWGMWTKYAANPILGDTKVNGTLVKSILTDIDDPLRRPIMFPHPTKGNSYWLAYANIGFGATIRLAYSNDLLTWTPYAATPMVPLSSGEYYLSSPHLFKNGSLYYLVYDVAKPSPHGEAQRIAYATAPSPLGPWTKGPVILDLGGPGQWDEGRVTEPHVYKYGDTYYLYYMGDLLPPYARGEQVAVATTPATLFPAGPWTKRGLLLPIGQSSTAWDRGLTADPSLIKVGDLHYMLYTGSTGDNNWKLGIAWATDPLGPWQRPTAPALLPGPTSWDNGALVRGMIIAQDDTFYLYYSGYGDSMFRGGVAIANPSVTPTPAPTRTPTRTPTVTPTAPRYSVAVNAGGPAYTDRRGAIWQADKAYAPGSWGYVGGSAYAIARPINGTDDDPLYQTEHWGMTEYRFDAPNGIYQVDLHLAEIYWLGGGKRVFSVALENQTVINDLDLYSVVGRDMAYVRTFTVTVNDGALNIGFSATVNEAKVNALRVTSVDETPSPTNTPVSTATPTTVGHTMTATATPTLTPTSSATPAATSAWRVNCGGDAYTDGLGRLWLGDRSFSSGGWGYVNGRTASATQPIAGTDDPVLYRSQRDSMSRYRFTAPDGRYNVVLRFAETYQYTAVGFRVFNVTIEDVQVLTKFDILATAGRYRAVDRSFTAVVNDGVLDITFLSVVGPPSINAIEISRLDD
jgi:hypothetical protein